ncbi:MAG TPA: threonine synthase [Flavitalea sp.]|nr:threonine synthase [Flavitalea sp.]
MTTEMPAPVMKSGLICSLCKKTYNYNVLQTVSACCSQPLISENFYKPANSAEIITNEPSMWRYRALLPALKNTDVVSLGEGWTPMVHLLKTSNQLQQDIWLKDESVNPTGSFKARGMSVAVSRLKEFGIKNCAIATAGNAGGALSAYCAKAGIKATIFMPAQTPALLKEECEMFGATVVLVDGLIDACGKSVTEFIKVTGAFNVSTFKEPYRLEGKKTLGYENAEQLQWKLPDVILYPTGGGTGYIGMWKAFQEMKALGWIGSHLPRMVIVQSQNCAPMKHIYERGFIPDDFKPEPSDAYGLAVPYPFAKDIMAEVLNESGGTVVTVSEHEIQSGMSEIAGSEGILLGPEGSATYMALKKLIKKDWLKQDESALIFNTGSWARYH